MAKFPKPAKPICDVGLTRGYANEEAIRGSANGTACFCDPRSPNTCGTCLHMIEKGPQKGRCVEYARRRQGRYGAKIAPNQKACRMWEARPGRPR
jgi:hypothetical protein